MAGGQVYKKGNPSYEKYIHSAAWRKKADQRMEMDHGICCVCGAAATEVHHLTYDRFGKEQMDDLVSLCRRCHAKAEELYDPAVTPWAMDEAKPEGNNFMAAMRVDAVNMADAVYEYIKEVRGRDFDSLMVLRQPDDAEGKRYWNVLRKAVDALCRKRYSRTCVEDRRVMMLDAIANHIGVICLAELEHYVRNALQRDLHEVVVTDYSLFETWKAVEAELGISPGTRRKLQTDDGTSFGPSLREAVLYYCGLDAAAGIRPVPGFVCLSSDDYAHLNDLADYMAEVSGSGAFKGEYRRDEHA